MVQHNVAFTNCKLLLSFLHIKILTHSSIANQEQRLQESTLNLMTKCLSYDFNGTSVDESGEDIGIIQVIHIYTYFFMFKILISLLIDTFYLEILL